MYSNGENTIMTMRYSLYFEAELIIINNSKYTTNYQFASYTYDYSK